MHRCMMDIWRLGLNDHGDVTCILTKNSMLVDSSLPPPTGIYSISVSRVGRQGVMTTVVVSQYPLALNLVGMVISAIQQRAHVKHFTIGTTLIVQGNNKSGTGLHSFGTALQLSGTAGRELSGRLPPAVPALSGVNRVVLQVPGPGFTEQKLLCFC